MGRGGGQGGRGGYNSNSGSNNGNNNGNNNGGYNNGGGGNNNGKKNIIEKHYPEPINLSDSYGNKIKTVYDPETRSWIADVPARTSSDGDMLMDTPNTGTTLVVKRYALRSQKEEGPGTAWRRMLEPLTAKHPLPLEYQRLLDQHFGTVYEHRPSQLKFRGLEISDYARYRDETNCFVCAALADLIVTKQAEKALKGPVTPQSVRFVTGITPAMGELVSNCPQLAKLIGAINIACNNQDGRTLTRLLIRPDAREDTPDTPANERTGMTQEHSEFLSALQQELKTICPGSDEGLLHQSLATLTMAGWLSAKPVVTDYLRLIRDWVKPVGKQQVAQLKKMTDDAIIALGDSTYGSLILPTVLDLSRILALVACKHGTDTLANGNSIDSQASTKHAKFLEDCANSLREAFIKCLVGGSSGSAAHSTAPDGKRTGIYITSNSCLRLLYQCRKLRNAQQMFVSIDAQSPFLNFYPRAQRITYLYYLGAYHFANNHFYRSQLALQAAYNLCHRQDLPHRRLILRYLIAANTCLGRFPSQTLLSRSEATDLAPHFYSLCKIISQGDLGAFQAHLDVSSETSHWFLRKRILLQLRNRGEVLVWRALIKKTFKYVGLQPEGNRMVPYLRLPLIQAAAQFSLNRAATTARTLTKRGTFSFMTQVPTPPAEEDYADPDLDGVDEAVNETGFDVDSGSYDDDLIGQHQDSFFTPPDEEANPTMAEIQSILASLIQQGFLRGFLTHGDNPRFAVPGSGAHGGPLIHGFPNIWEVIKSREDETVPGWVRREDQQKIAPFAPPSGFGVGGGGRVVNLSGARPVGAGS